MLRLRRGAFETELPDLAAVRAALSSGKISADEEVWDPVEERWLAVSSIVPAAPGAVSEAHGARPNARPAVRPPRPHGLLRSPWTWAVVGVVLSGAVLASVLLTRDPGSSAALDAGGVKSCDGGRYDPATGLCWQDPPTPRDLTWDQAVRHCSVSRVGGLSAGSWRVPTLDELRSLIRGCPATEAEGPCGFTDSCLDLQCGVEGDACLGCEPANGGPGRSGAYWPEWILGGQPSAYWSSSSEDGTAKYVVAFDHAFVAAFPKGAKYRVRCVRPGP